MQQSSHVDLVFSVKGRTLARDHGYALYGALSRAVPSLHGTSWLSVHPIPGRLIDPQTLDLEGGSQLRLRLPVEHIGQVLGLTDAILEVSGSRLELGPPTVQQLRPAAILDARLVVIKLTEGPSKPFDPAAFAQRFLAEAHRQLARHGIAGVAEVRGRGRITVGGRRVIGFAVRVAELSPEHSIALQIHGLGGKRSMGCGVFRPSRWKAAAALEPAA
jgi:CRISPR-associated protein Cas6